MNLLDLALLKKFGASGGNTGGTSAPSDWNASEGEKGYIKNRTHYDEVAVGAILDGTYIMFGDDGQATVSCDRSIFEGEKYTVSWDGVDYVCPAVKVEEEGAEGYLIGNLGALSGEEGTGEPFLIAYVDTSGQLTVFTFESRSGVTINITGLTTVVKELPKRFISSHLKTVEENTKADIRNELMGGQYLTKVDILENNVQYTENFEIGDAYSLVGKTCTIILKIKGVQYTIHPTFYYIRFYRNDGQTSNSVLAAVTLFGSETEDKNFNVKYDLKIQATDNDLRFELM